MTLARFVVLGGGLAAALALSILACGGSTSDIGSSNPNDASSGTPGKDGGDGRDSDTNGEALSPQCPSSAPGVGAACTRPDLSCEYGGEGPALACTTIFTCGPTGMWASEPPFSGCKGLQSENEATCPASFTALASGAACPSPLQGACAYPEGLCECATCFSPDGGLGSSKAWSCVGWPKSTAPCPTPRPRMGAACTVEGQECDYASVCSSVSLGLPNVKCVGGLWKSQPIPLPPCALPTCGH